MPEVDEPLAQETDPPLAGVRAIYMFYIYFLKSKKNNKIYSGMTEKIPAERLKDHNYGSNKWTRENGPFEIAYFEEYICKEDALKRESFYKTGFGRNIRNAILKELKII